MRVTGVYSKRDIVTTRAHAREGFTRLAAAGLLLTITSIGCSNVKKPGPTVPTGTPVPAVFVSPEGKAMLDFPYHEEVHKAMWAGLSLLSDEVSKTVRADVLRLLNGLAARLEVEGVAHA